jgi:transposase-like protein
MDEGKLRMARSLMADKRNSVDDVCRTLGVSKSTLYKYLREGSSKGSETSGSTGT